MGEPLLFGHENSLLTFSRKPRNCPGVWGPFGGVAHKHANPSSAELPRRQPIGMASVPGWMGGVWKF